MDNNHLIIRCLKCGQKNRLHSRNKDRQPICGKCRFPLDQLIIQCFFCGTKNRISEDKFTDRPICGRCHLPLYRSSAQLINDDNFEEEILRFPGSVLLGCIDREEDDIFSSIFNYLSSKYGGGIKIAKCIYSENPIIKRNLSLSKSPSLVVLYNGAIKSTFIGLPDNEEVENSLLSAMK
jgi:thioredoxin 2